MRSALAILCLLAQAPGLASARPITLEDQYRIARLGDLALSPDGRWLALTAQTLDRDLNGRRIVVWKVPTGGGSSGQAQPLALGGHVSEAPSWSPDGTRLAVASDAADGTPQVVVIDMSSGAQKKLTQLALGVSGPIWSPDGKSIAFVSDVFVGCEARGDACNKAREENAKSGKVKAREFDHLFIRHWKEWRGGKRQHLFVVSAGGGTPRDLTPGDQDYPTWRLLDPQDYRFTPDSRALVVASKAAAGEAWSTNSDLWQVALDGRRPQRLTQNAGDDAQPRFSSDGRRLAWRAQTRAGYESDRWRLMVMDWPGGKPRELLRGWDRSVRDLAWSLDGKLIWVMADDRGQDRLFAVPAGGGEPRAVSGDLSAADFAPAKGGTVYLVGSKSARAPEVFRAGGGAPELVSHINAEAMRGLDLAPFEPLETTAADGTAIHGFLLKPPGFRPGVRYPTLVFIHGGPQGAWHDSFSTVRWSAHLYAARGYVVMMANPRGSSGYGQTYQDAVNNDWGGKPYDDILRLTDAAARLPYVDGGRMCALGASYGGFMINWIAGHTDRFRCLVSHAGPFDQRSMYFQTEELWFPEWEMGGTPWSNPQSYDRWSPARYAERFRTPTLVTHGELDFRVPVGEGMAMFTALQRRGVSSKLLVFPDEGHWITRPLNLERWLGEIWGWLDHHLATPHKPPVR
jgi:dipeptidyl aminopeptidase/acylaminoacyl peptidase